MKRVLYLLLLLAFGCSSFQAKTPYYSSRDITPEEWRQLHNIHRTPAEWGDQCASALSGFFSSASSKPQKILDDYKTLPFLSQLKSEEGTFKNGRKFLAYQANPNVLYKNADYDEFLKDTVEIVFEPVDPFGHINLRIGQSIYSFNNVKWTSINNFAPRMRKSSKPDELHHSHGFIFNVGREHIEKVVAEIDKFYKSSQAYNIPAFDSYSSLLKVEKDPKSGGLKYISDAPKYGNNERITGKIEEVNGKFFLAADNGMKMPLTKKKDEFFSESFSCSSSAGHVLRSFFNLEVSHDYSAKSLIESLLNGNIGEKRSPVVVMKYYE